MRIRLVTGAMLGMALAMMGLISWQGFRALEEGKEALRQESETHHFLLHLGRLVFTMVDAESGARGFNITGEQTYRERYDSAAGRLEEELGTLKGLAARDALKKKTIDGFETMCRQRLTLLQEAIGKREELGFEAARMKITSGRGEELMGRIRSAVFKIQEAEEDLLRQRIGARERAEKRITRILASGVVLAIGLVSSSFWLLRREMLSRERAERERREMLMAEQTARQEAEAARGDLARVNEELQRSEALYRTVAQSLPGGAISVVGSDLRYIIVEGHLVEQLGLNKQAMIGQRVKEVFEPEIAADRAEYFRRALAGETTGYETEYHGYTIWSRFVPLRGAGGLLGAMSLAIDVSDKKREERELIRAKEEVRGINAELERRVEERTADLREVVAEMEQMSYSMIHDLRAPLRAIQSFSELIEKDIRSGQTEEASELLGRMREAGERMDSLVCDVLNYSKVVRERLPLRPLDLGQLLNGLHKTYLNLQEPVAEIKIELEKALVLSNEGALTLCFSNLLANAVKFVPPGIKPRVRIWSEATFKEPVPPEKNRSETIRVWVEDNGIGIPAEAHAKIFRMFQRMHSQQQYSGTGMGLTIVRKAVERVGGRIGVESEPGKGSRFWVELPVVPVEEGSQKQHKATEALPPV